MPRRLKNIRPWKGKWQAYTEVGGKPRYKSFPKNTSVAVMREWVEKTKKQGQRPVAVDGSFGADIAHYLKRIAALPTYKQKAAHLELWGQALGRDRPRRTITAGEIDAVMQHWLVTPTRPKKGRPSGEHGLDVETVRKRRTSLNSLFSKLDGKSAENPLRDAKLSKPLEAEIRGTDYPTITRIIAAMPDYKDTLKGSPKKVSASKLRVAALAYTGLPPGILATVRPEHVNLAARTVRVGKRKKGGGVEPRTLSLTPQGTAAMKALMKAGALVKFSPSALNMVFKRACRRVGVSGLTIYDLRHSFGAQMYRSTKDEKTVGRFLLHAENSTQTARYRKAADAEVDRAAADNFGRAIKG